MPQNSTMDATNDTILGSLFAVDIHVSQVRRFNISWQFFVEDM